MQHFNTANRVHGLTTRLASVPESYELAGAAAQLLRSAAVLELSGASRKARRHLKRAAELVFRAHREAVKAETLLAQHDARC